MSDTVSKKGGAAPCGLWIRIGPDIAADILLRDLNQIFFAINGSKYEKNMHAFEISGDAENEEFVTKVKPLLDLARSKGIATIFRGPAAQAKELGTEGVLLATPEELDEAKTLFGEEGIIGIACGLSNEKAAAAYDAGTDFVTFGTGKKALPDAAILQFWTMLTDLPAVIEGPVCNDYCGYYVQAGAAFIDAGDYIWSHGKGVMQGTVNMLHAIDLALEEQKKDTVQ